MDAEGGGGGKKLIYRRNSRRRRRGVNTRVDLQERGYRRIGGGGGEREGGIDGSG